MAGAAEPAQVILLGADSPIGLTIIRELGGHGVAVHAIGASRRALGLYSRFVASRHRRVQGDDALTAQLEGIAGPLGGAWVL